MAGHSPGRTWAAVALVLVLWATLAPAAQAQLLPGSVFGFQMTADRGFVHVPYLRNGIVNVTVTDYSTGELGAGPDAPVRSRIYFTTAIVGNDTRGWVASMSFPSVATGPGRVQVVQLNIQAGATIVDPSVEVLVSAELRSLSGRAAPVNMTVLAVAKPFSYVYVQTVGLPPEFHPDQTATVQLRVTSQNYYPDMFDFTITGPRGWAISGPSTLYMGPRTSQVVTITLNAPDTPFFLIYPQTLVFNIRAHSVTDPAASYSYGLPVSFSGGWLPGWTFPHILLFVIGALVVAREGRRRHEEKSLERGRPLPTQMTPEEEARLAAFRKSDPERAAAMEERLAVLHKKRVSAWKHVYRDRREVERDLVGRERDRHDQVIALQKAELRETKRERTAQTRGMKREEKRAKRERARLEKRKVRAEKAAAKAHQAEEKRFQRERKAELKLTERKMKRLEKRRAIQGEREGKIKARQLQRLEKRKQRLAKVREKELRQKEKELEKARKRSGKGEV